MLGKPWVPGLLLACACAHPTPAPPETGGSTFIGMWRLVSVEAVRQDGSTITSRWGKHPIGYIGYDGSGHMAAQIMGDPRPTFADPDHPTPAEGFAAYDSYLAYAGRYTFDSSRQLLTHHVEDLARFEGSGTGSTSTGGFRRRSNHPQWTAVQASRGARLQPPDLGTGAAGGAERRLKGRGV